VKLKIGNKSGLKYFDIENVKSWKPCYDPIKHLQPGIRYNAVKILEREDIPAQDRLWVVLRTDLVSEKCMRLFAVWCARQVVKPDADPRTLNALEIAEKYANGEATDSELSAAYSAANSAAYSAAYSAANSAAYSAANIAANIAANSAAYIAANSAARQKQIEKLIEMIKIEGLERVKK
jgi:hypothetical protein